MKHWKTTISGLGILLTQLPKLIDNPASLAQPETLAALITAVGLILAHDAKKGEKVKVGAGGYPPLPKPLPPPPNPPLRAVAALLIASCAVCAQVCVPVPVAGTTITQSTLDALRTRGAIAPGVSSFASLEAFAIAFGGSLPYIPQGSAEAKFWADFTPGADYVTLDGSLDTSDTATWSDFSMNVYGRTVAGFYQDRAKANDPVFRRIPRFKRFTVAQPATMNMLLGVGKPGPRTVTVGEAPYPLARLQDDPVGENGKAWSWPRNHIARFNPDTGQVEVCNYQDYDRAYPLVYRVDPPGGGSGAIRVRGLTDEAFLAAVGAALFGGGTPAERVAKILGHLEVK